jgi:hypothetical protein
VLIYVEYITERLLYTLDFVFTERKIPYEITNDGIQFMAAQGHKLNYSSPGGLDRASPGTSPAFGTRGRRGGG